MIITRTPLRMSFAGGGTDLPAFYREEPGSVVSVAINKYVYVFAHQYFNEQILIKYSETELVNHPSEIKMRVFREALALYGVNRQIEIGIVADLPKEGGSGLGGSTAFSVGLLNALGHYTDRTLSREALAAQSSELEMNILKNPIGKQDQYASALGGMNCLTFNPDETVRVEPIFLKPAVRAELESRLILFYTGQTRRANDILERRQGALKNEGISGEKRQIYRRMKQYADELHRALQQNQIGSFGEILHENWLLKKQLTDGISDTLTDDRYARALNAGATGGKMLGAGGGGFLLFDCPPEKQDKLREALSDLREFPVRFEAEGTRVILKESV